MCMLENWEARNVACGLFLLNVCSRTLKYSGPMRVVDEVNIMRYYYH